MDNGYNTMALSLNVTCSKFTVNLIGYCVRSGVKRSETTT